MWIPTLLLSRTSTCRISLRLPVMTIPSLQFITVPFQTFTPSPVISIQLSLSLPIIFLPFRFRLAPFNSVRATPEESLQSRSLYNTAWVVISAPQLRGVAFLDHRSCEVKPFIFLALLVPKTKKLIINPTASRKSTRILLVLILRLIALPPYWLNAIPQLD